MSDTITQYECPEHGDTIIWWYQHQEDLCQECKAEPIERTYVAVDALLSDDALEAGVGVPYEEYAVEDLRAVVRAAVEAVKS